MKINRREFLTVAGAGALAAQLPAGGAEKPLLRIGITTDTHFGRNDVKGVERVEKAFRLWKAQGCDAIVNCGDIADRHYPKWYAEVCRLRERVFDDPKTAPKELWVYAGHDRIDMPDDKDKKGPGNYQLLKSELKIQHEPWSKHRWAGFNFLTIPCYAGAAELEKFVGEACAETPEKPVFVFDHHPAFNTTESSAHWGDGMRLKVLSKFPQVIHVTGHAHGSLWNEQNIHQGAFTSVSAACLTYFGEPYAGCSHSETGQNRSVLTLEVFSDHAVFRRYLIDSGEEIGADEPWTVNWPYDPKHPFYSRENMKARHSAPEFPAGAALEVFEKTVDGPRVGLRGRRLCVKIPTVPGRFTRHYSVEGYRRGTDGRPVQIFQHDVRGEFWREPKKRAAVIVHAIDAGFFIPGEEIALVVTPCDFWGNRGRPIKWKGTAPADDYRQFWEGELEKGQRLPEVPAEIAGRDVKVVIELETDQPEAPTMEVGCKACDFWWAARVSTAGGAKKLTYLFYIDKLNAKKRYEVCVWGRNADHRIKFGKLRLLVKE